MIMVALSPWLLGESVGRAQWLAVAVGFGGMLLIVRPGADLPALGTVLMAVAAVSYAIFQLLTRKLAGQVPGHVQYAYTAFICLLMTALPAPFFLPQPWPGLADSLVIIALGLCNGLAQILLIGAFQRVEASTLAPLNYCHLLMAVAFSTFWFGMPPDAPATAGMALIVAAGIFLVTRRAPARRACPSATRSPPHEHPAPAVPLGIPRRRPDAAQPGLHRRPLARWPGRAAGRHQPGHRPVARRSDGLLASRYRPGRRGRAAPSSPACGRACRAASASNACCAWPR